MKLDAFEYEIPWSENWQKRAAVGWFAGTAVSVGMMPVSIIPKGVWAVTGLICAMAGVFRWWRGKHLTDMQKNLEGRETTFTTFDELVKLANGHEGRQWLGKGFIWENQHAQRAFEIQKRTEDIIEQAKLSETEIEPAQIGQRWLHGIETNERNIWQPLSHVAAHTLIIGTPGSGKAQPLDAPVLTPSGFVPMGSLAVGSEVMTADGTPAAVTGIFPQGVKPICRLEFKDGRSVEATEDHLWEVFFRGEVKDGERYRRLSEILVELEEDLAEFADAVIDLRGVIPAVLPTRALMRLLATSLTVEVPVMRRSSARKERLIPSQKPLADGLARLIQGGGMKDDVRGAWFGGETDDAAVIGQLETRGTRSLREKVLVKILRGRRGGHLRVATPLALPLCRTAWSVGWEAALVRELDDGRTVINLERPAEHVNVSMVLGKGRQPADDAGQEKRPWRSELASITMTGEREAQCIMIDHPRHLYVTADYVMTHNTRMLDLLVSQAILRGECVMILDPKGDNELRENAKRACKQLGRANDFIQFHLAFPEESVRIDPLRNFSNNFEIAERIRALLASGGSADTFSNFSWLAVNNLVEGMMLCYEKPTLMRIRMLLEGGIENLVSKAVESYARKVDTDFDNHRKSFKTKDLSPVEVAELWCNFYRRYIEPNHPHAGLNGLISQFHHDAEHFSKMVASLQPIMQMLTSGSIAPLLSPSGDEGDMRPLLDMKRIVDQNLVAYFGFDAMKAGQTASAIGSLLLADLTSVAGSRYDYAQRLNQKMTPVNVFVDEASEVVNDPFIQMLNKARGAGFRIWVATQTYADFQSKLQDKAKATQVLANVNNIIAFRTTEQETQKYFCDPIPKTRIKYVLRNQGQNTDNNEPIVHASNYGERMVEEEADLVPPQILGMLPGLEYFARISGGLIMKGRIPILVTPEELEAQKNRK